VYFDVGVGSRDKAGLGQTSRFRGFGQATYQICALEDDLHPTAAMHCGLEAVLALLHGLASRGNNNEEGQQMHRRMVGRRVSVWP
jgi:hypothetical protein